jgi:hypothetical protein
MTFTIIEVVTLPFDKLMMEIRNNDLFDTGSILVVFVECTRSIRLLDILQLSPKQCPVDGYGASVFHGWHLIALPYQCAQNDIWTNGILSDALIDFPKVNLDFSSLKRAHHLIRVGMDFTPAQHQNKENLDNLRSDWPSSCECGSNLCRRSFLGFQ